MYLIVFYYDYKIIRVSSHFKSFTCRAASQIGISLMKKKKIGKKIEYEKHITKKKILKKASITIKPKEIQSSQNFRTS